MSDWYVSSAAYAGYTAFVASHAYTVGNIVVPTAPALKAKWVFRCTTAGTSSTEPSWPTANSSTITTGGATFTNVTGQSTFFWTAAAGDLPTLLGAVGAQRFVAGDRMFVSSDHSETQTANTPYGAGAGSASFSSGQVLSVSRAGSTPPVAADLTAGATCSCSAFLTLETNFPTYHYGITYVDTGVVGIGINNGGGGFKSIILDTCQLSLSGAQATAKVLGIGASTLILNNSTIKFSAVNQTIACSSGPMEIIWQNTAMAIAGGTVPTTLLSGGTNTLTMSAIMRGLDISAVTTTLTASSNCGNKYLFDSCKIASGASRYNVSGVVNTRDLVELVNCNDGTHFLSESYQPSGTVTTEFTITLSSGAADDVGAFSHKMVSNTNVDKLVAPLNSFWFDVENTATGSSKTATVEIVSSASLNNDDISLFLEYQGTSSSSLASFASSLPTTVLTSNAAVTTSSATWNSSPSTPVNQKLQITFTPQVAGRVRGQVRLGKASTTVYVNPQIKIT